MNGKLLVYIVSAGLLIILTLIFYRVILLGLSALALSSALVFVFSDSWRSIWLESWREKLDENAFAFIRTFTFDLLTGGVLYCVDLLAMAEIRKRRRDDDKK